MFIFGGVGFFTIDYHGRQLRLVYGQFQNSDQYHSAAPGRVAEVWDRKATSLAKCIIEISRLKLL